MPAILFSRDMRGTVTAVSVVAIVLYILIPLVFIGLVAATIWLVLRNKKRRKAQALAQAEGSNIHLYSNGYQTTQNTGYHPNGQQFAGANSTAGGWAVNGAPNNNANNNGSGWVTNGSTGPAAPVYRAMPPPGNNTEHSISHAGEANGSKPTGQDKGLAAPQSVYNQNSLSPATSTANLAGNAQPPATR